MHVVQHIYSHTCTNTMVRMHVAPPTAFMMLHTSSRVNHPPLLCQPSSVIDTPFSVTNPQPKVTQPPPFIYLPKGICAGMPAELASNGISNGRHKLSSQTKVSTQLSTEVLGAVERIGQIPLKLVHQGDISDMDVQLQNESRKWKSNNNNFDNKCCSSHLDDDSPHPKPWWWLSPPHTLMMTLPTPHLDDDSSVFLVIRDHVWGELLHLLLNGGSYRRPKCACREVQVITKQFSKLLWSHYALCGGRKEGEGLDMRQFLKQVLDEST